MARCLSCTRFLQQNASSPITVRSLTWGRSLKEKRSSINRACIKQTSVRGGTNISIVSTAGRHVAMHTIQSRSLYCAASQADENTTSNSGNGASSSAFTPVEEETATENMGREQFQKARKRDLGVLPSLPKISPPEEMISSAIKKARRVGGSKKAKGAGPQARSRAASQLDALTKAMAVPLGRYL